MTVPPLSLDGIERWAGSQPGKVFSVLLQPLIQCPGLGVEPQGQFDVPVGFQGIETEHVGQVLGAREAKLLIVLRVCLKGEGVAGSVRIHQHLSILLRWWGLGDTSVPTKVLAKST